MKDKNDNKISCPRCGSKDCVPKGKLDILCIDCSFQDGVNFFIEENEKDFLTSLIENLFGNILDDENKI